VVRLSGGADCGFTQGAASDDDQPPRRLIGAVSPRYGRFMNLTCRETKAGSGSGLLLMGWGRHGTGKGEADGYSPSNHLTLTNRN